MKSEAAKKANQKYAELNKEKLKASNLKYRQNHPELCLLRAAKSRAAKYNLPFSITEEDVLIPTYCPILKLKLERKFGGYGGHDSSPSLDRIVPELGYVPGNVWVISQKANSMKSNASVRELQLFKEWIRNTYD